MRAFVAAVGRAHRATATACTTPSSAGFRYGVQVNSLGLTEAQPENNVQRIVLEMLGVTLSKDARARAVQLPAWNEALGLPRPWDQQWSLRMQQVLAFETDLLEYDDLFAGSHVVEAKVAELVAGGARRDRPGPGAWAARSRPSSRGYMKSALVASHSPSAGAGSSPARTSSSASTGSPRPSRTRSPPTSTAADPDRRPGGRGSARSTASRAVAGRPRRRRGRRRADRRCATPRRPTPT